MRQPEASSKRARARPLVVCTYQIAGVILCRDVFLSIFDISHSVLDRFFDKLREEGIRFPLPGENRRGQCTVGRVRQRSAIALNFIDLVAQRYALPCQGARGSKPDQHALLLPQVLPKKAVYDLYRQELEAQPDAGKPLGPNAFYFTWRAQRPHLHVATQITDYCATCNDLSQHFTDVAQQTLTAHRILAHESREHYKRRILASRHADSNTVHLTMNFADRVYLPFQHGHPSHRSFIAGLNFDMFGISNDTFGSQVTYGLTEGHWPNEKSTNSIFSMLHNFLTTPAFVHGDAVRPRVLQISADCCTGENKNRWMLWYFSYLTLIGMFDEVQVSFLVAGHTKSLCEARFALIKRQLRATEALIPAHMHNVISCASPVMTGAKADEIAWCDWKAFLERFFSGLVKSISKHHVFRFSAAQPGVVHCSPSVDAPETAVHRYQLLKPTPGTLDLLQAEHADVTTHAFVDFTPARREYVDKELVQRFFDQGVAPHLRDEFLHA